MERNVQALVRAVGIKLLAGRLTGELTGGNKRKLSLAVALIGMLPQSTRSTQSLFANYGVGNPPVLFLHEPSSSIDPLTKRSMWKTFSKFAPNRSILLTVSPPCISQNSNHKLTIPQSHSIEEADTIADRVGVMAKHILNVGTTSHLRTKHGYGFHVHSS